jgi:hypothetical protein
VRSWPPSIAATRGVFPSDDLQSSESPAQANRNVTFSIEIYFCSTGDVSARVAGHSGRLYKCNCLQEVNKDDLCVTVRARPFFVSHVNNAWHGISYRYLGQGTSKAAPLCPRLLRKPLDQPSDQHPVHEFEIRRPKPIVIVYHMCVPLPYST